MNEKQQGLKILPAWFDLNNYKLTKDFDATDWHANLTGRLCNFLGASGVHGLPCKPKSKDVESLPFDKGSLSFLEAYWASGALVPANRDWHNPAVAISNKPENNTLKIVQDLMVLDLLYGAQEILQLPGYRDDFDVWQKSMDDGVYPLMWDSADTVISSLRSFAYAEVNLETPIDLAVEDFKRWLIRKKNEKAQVLQRKVFSESDFASWTRYGVLAYIDLACWAYLTGKTIPRWVYAEALFPNWDGDTVEVISKTTKKLAKKVFSFETLEMLQQQSYTERLELKTEEFIPEI